MARVGTVEVGDVVVTQTTLWLAGLSAKMVLFAASVINLIIEVFDCSGVLEGRTESDSGERWPSFCRVEITPTQSSRHEVT